MVNRRPRCQTAVRSAEPLTAGALAPTFAVFAVVMVMRRAGEYALARPGREILFTVVPPEAKYKAKNVQTPPSIVARKRRR